MLVKAFTLKFREQELNRNYQRILIKWNTEEHVLFKHHAVFSIILLLLGKAYHRWSPEFLCAYLGKQKPPDRNSANFLCPLPATWSLICPLVSLPASCLRGWGQMPSSQSQFYLHVPALSSCVLPSPASVTVSCLVPCIQDVSLRQHSASFFNRRTFPIPFPALVQWVWPCCLHSSVPSVLRDTYFHPHRNLHHITAAYPGATDPGEGNPYFWTVAVSASCIPSLLLFYLERVLISHLKLASKYSLPTAASQVANTTGMFISA